MNISTFIVLVNYNNHDDTIKCLESIRKAGYSRNVVVVDNNSTIPGIENIKKQFSNIVLIKNEKNIGFGQANNRGIKYIIENKKCKYIFILNNDTIIRKDTVQILENALNEEHSAAIASPKIVMMENPNILWYGGGLIDWARGSVRLPGYLQNANTKSANQRKFVEFASGCAMLIRTSVLIDCGGFDHRFFMYEEDLELCCRLLERNWQIIYSPSSVVYHKCQGSTRNEGDEFKKIWSPMNPNLSFYMYHITKNRFLSMFIHAKGLNRVKFFIFFPLILIFKVVQFLRYKRFDGILSIVKGFIDFIKIKRKNV